MSKPSQAILPHGQVKLLLTYPLTSYRSIHPSQHSHFSHTHFLSMLVLITQYSGPEA